MPKISFSDGLAIAGIVLGIVLIVLDKSSKLRGPTLLVMLALAAAMTLPLALGNSWVGDAPSGMLRFTRGMFMIFAVGLIYSVIAIWISPDSTAEKRETVKKETPPSLDNWNVAGSQLIKDVGASRSSRSAFVTVNTALLSPFARDYFFLLIVRVADNSVDALTDPRLEKSQAFAITGEFRTIQVNLSEEFIQRADATEKRFSQVSLQYYFALIPKHVRAEQILTLSDITALGGRQLLSHPSPEIVVRPVAPPK